MKNIIIVLALAVFTMPLSAGAFEIPDISNINIKNIEVSPTGSVKIESDQGDLDVSSEGGVKIKTKSGNIDVSPEQVKEISAQAEGAGIKGIDVGNIKVENGLIQVGEIKITPGIVKLPGVSITKNTIHAPNVDIQISSGETLPEIEAGKSLIDADGTLFIKVGDVTVSATNADVKVAGNNVKVGKVGNITNVEIVGVSATTNEKVKIENGTISIVGKAGNAEVSIMPDKAIEISGVTKPESVSISLENGKAVYNVNTSEARKVLGIFAVAMNKSVSVSAETGAKLDVSTPWWSFMAF